MGLLETVLNPIVWVMELILNFYAQLFSSMGISILLLSFTFAMVLLPLQRIASAFEQRIGAKVAIVENEVRELKGKLKGEQLFAATEEIYGRHGYHPIQSVGMGTSFIVMLPVLISAILLFTGGGLLAGKSFIFIDDLAKPDGLLGPINVLPLVMTAVTVVDARIRFRHDKRSMYRFFFIAIVLLLIVYNLASGLVLYWTGSNMTSMAMSRIRSA